MTKTHISQEGSCLSFSIRSEEIYPFPLMFSLTNKHFLLTPVPERLMYSNAVLAISVIRNNT